MAEESKQQSKVSKGQCAEPEKQQEEEQGRGRKEEERVESLHGEAGYVLGPSSTSGRPSEQPIKTQIPRRLIKRVTGMVPGMISGESREKIIDEEEREEEVIIEDEVKGPKTPIDPPNSKR